MKMTRFDYYQSFSFQKDSDIGLVIEGKSCDILNKRMLANLTNPNNVPLLKANTERSAHHIKRCTRGLAWCCAGENLPAKLVTDLF